MPDSIPNDSLPTELPDGWPIGSPESAGLNSDLLRGIGRHFESWTDANAHAILIARHGKLVYERYFTGEDQAWGKPLGRVTYDAAKRHDLRSITKSVTSLLVGIAVDRAWIGDLDASVFSFFPEHADLRTPDNVWTLTGEIFGELAATRAGIISDDGPPSIAVVEPRIQAGLRWRPIDDFNIDLIYGRNLQGENANWITLATTVRFSVK